MDDTAPSPATGMQLDTSIDDGRLRVTSGTPWEIRVGYSRAIRVGDQLMVTGTMALADDGSTVHPHDAGRQTAWILEKIRTAIEVAGGRMADVVRTRLYVTDLADAPAVGAAHHAVFEHIRPCATMVQIAGLVSPDCVIEIEVDAIVGAGDQSKTDAGG